MNEQPWNSRQIFAHHLTWFRDILTIHALTRTWIQDITLDRQDYELDRGISNEVAETLWMLDKFSQVAPSSTSDSATSLATQKTLESFLDDTLPDDLLGRMENTIRVVQAATLQNILGQNQALEAKSILGHMEQVSWKNGREHARSSRMDSREAYEDLREVYHALQDVPFLKAEGIARTHPHSVLKIQAQKNLLILESRVCPHQYPRMDIKLAAQPLCHLQSHWLRGFVYDLNPKIHIHFDKPDTYCRYTLRT